MTEKLLTPIMASIIGIIGIVIGTYMAANTVTAAAAGGEAAGMGSFPNAKSMNDLIPFFAYTGVAIGGLIAMLAGAFGFAGKGPLSIRG